MKLKTARLLAEAYQNNIFAGLSWEAQEKLAEHEIKLYHRWSDRAARNPYHAFRNWLSKVPVVWYLGKTYHELYEARHPTRAHNLQQALHWKLVQPISGIVDYSSVAEEVLIVKHITSDWPDEESDNEKITI